MNLHGAIVPVINLRRRFGLTAATYTKTTVVIVAMVRAATGNRTIGAVVDGVSDMLNINTPDIQPTPDFGAAGHTQFIHGLTTTESGMVMLLDMERLLHIEELFALAATSSQQAA